MRAYRVKMNNSQQNLPGEPEGVYYRHVTSETLLQAAVLAEHLFSGTCEAVTKKSLYPPSFIIGDMHEGKNYELLAAAKFTHDTIIFRKINGIIQVTLRGNKFTEKGSTYWLDLSILDYMIEQNQLKACNSLAFSELEFISVEVYNIVTQKKIPSIFQGMMNIGKRSS